MKIAIETARILIRELQPTDAEGMLEMDSDPEVKRYLGNKMMQTIDQAIELILFIRRQYVDNGVGRWAMEDRFTGEFIGWTGFKWTEETINGHSGHYDFGYRLKRKYWGRGYATEAARAALSFGIDTLKLKEIYAMTDIDNLASRRVLEKIGFKYAGLFPYDGALTWRVKDEPTTWFELDV